jgi:WD40 repeat protein
MNKYIFLAILFIFSNSFSITIEKQIKVSGGVLDIVNYQNNLIVSTEKGTVEILDKKSGKLIRKLTLPKFEDFMGGYQPPKVFSVDISPSGKTISMITEATGGNRELYVEQDDKLIKIIPANANLQLTKLRFFSDDLVILTTKGDELILLDLKSRKYVYRTQIGNYSFGDMALCDDKNRLVIGDEGGTAYLVDVKSGRLIRKFDKVNVDQIYRVDCKSGKILTGGRDRRVGYYDINTGSYKKLEAEFIVFSVALSPSAKKGAFQYNESNDIGIYDFVIDKLTTVKGHHSTVGVMTFLSEDELVSGSDDGKIIIWRIK